MALDQIIRGGDWNDSTVSEGPRVPAEVAVGFQEMVISKQKKSRDVESPPQSDLEWPPLPKLSFACLDLYYAHIGASDSH